MKNTVDKTIFHPDDKRKMYSLVRHSFDEADEDSRDEKNFDKEDDTNNGDDTSNKLNGYLDSEQQQEHIPYPKSVFFIIGNEFCERFCYYGMRTILSLFLVDILLYSESNAMVVYHTFSFLVMFFPLFGAIISDGFFGKFNTILYVSMIYAAGSILLSLTAAEPIGLPQRAFTIVSLLLLAVGTGGIKPCVAAFGGDQFVFPQQEKQFVRYFSMFYFSINAGSFISSFITPILREDVHCFGADSCYPLAFAVPGVLMIVAIVIFAAGRPMYKIIKPERNVCLDFAGCIGIAVKNKIVKRDVKVEHWLDHAKEKYGDEFVNDVRVTMSVLLLYAPLPIFWALYDQQGTAWTFQAVHMNGNIGFYTILPDQMQVVNAILVLIFIPAFSYGVYPLLGKFGLLTTPLQRMVAGGFLAALAFAIAAIVSITLEATDPVLPSAGNAQLRLYNTLKCDVTLNATIGLQNQMIVISPMSDKELDHKICYESIPFKINSITGCDDEYKGPRSLTFNVFEKNAYGFYLNETAMTQYTDDIQKDESGLSRIRTIVNNIRDVNINVSYLEDNDDHDVALTFPITNSSLFDVDPGTYKVNGSDLEITLEMGGVYTAIIQMDNNNNIPSSITLLTTTKPNSIHMLWLLPQYIVLTAAEMMFSITSLEFSYSQAPNSMKSILQAANLLTDSLGNVIIVIIEAANLFDKQSNEFFLYAALMVLDMVLFGFLAVKYKYVDSKATKNESTELKEIDKKNSDAGSSEESK